MITMPTQGDDDNSSADGAGKMQELILISNSMLAVTMLPLVFVAAVSYRWGLDLEKPILVGTARTFLQLTALGLVLRPIFVLGRRWWWLVVGYVALMILLAAHESATRSKYYFPGMYVGVLGSIASNVLVVSVFAFVVVLRPTPAWDPHYVIPIVGMLLGNSINAVSLSLSSMTTSLVENAAEIELYLSFGATRVESTSRLLNDAVRIGATPQLNSMAIIGLISIPGMMTGQILGGTSATQASRYQIFIIYLIGVCAFCTLITEIYVAMRAGFDHNHTLVTDHFINRTNKKRRLSFELGNELKLVGDYILKLSSGIFPSRESNDEINDDIVENENRDEIIYLAPYGKIKITSYDCFNIGNEQYVDECKGPTKRDNKQARLSQKRKQDNTSKDVRLQVCNLMHSFDLSEVAEQTKRRTQTILDSSNQGDTENAIGTSIRKYRTLFQNISFCVEVGDIAFVKGPSGVGKSTLLRIIAGLLPIQNGTVHLQATNREGFTLQKEIVKKNSEASCIYRCMTLWRQHVRYITQYKISIPGTPTDFLKKVTTFKVWSNSHDSTALTYTAMLEKSYELLSSWGVMDAKMCLETEWSLLSGGECQRVLLAISLASRPKVLLMDEATSNLDFETKLRIEKSIQNMCKEESICVLWVTHDQDQVKRFGSTNEENDL